MSAISMRLFGDLEMGAFFQYEGSVYRKLDELGAVLLRDPTGNINPKLTDFRPLAEVMVLKRWA